MAESPLHLALANEELEVGYGIRAIEAWRLTDGAVAEPATAFVGCKDGSVWRIQVPASFGAPGSCTGEVQCTEVLPRQDKKPVDALRVSGEGEVEITCRTGRKGGTNRIIASRDGGVWKTSVSREPPAANGGNGSPGDRRTGELVTRQLRRAWFGFTRAGGIVRHAERTGADASPPAFPENTRRPCRLDDWATQKNNGGQPRRVYLATDLGVWTFDGRTPAPTVLPGFAGRCTALALQGSCKSGWVLMACDTQFRAHVFTSGGAAGAAAPAWAPEGRLRLPDVAPWRAVGLPMVGGGPFRVVLAGHDSRLLVLGISGFRTPVPA